MEQEVNRDPKVIVDSVDYRIVRHYPPEDLYPTYTFEEKRPNAVDCTSHFVEVASWTMRPGETLPTHFVITRDLFIEMIRLIDGAAIPAGGASFMSPMSNNGSAGEQVIH